MTELSNSIRKSGVTGWLCRGWQDFVQTWQISLAFSFIFLVISVVAYWQLLKLDLGLVLYPFITGFMVLAPLLVTGFQKVGRILHEGGQPRFMDLLTGIKESTPGIFFITFVLCVCYLIWVTDAIVIYGMYFGVKAVPLSTELLTDPVLRESLFSYLMLTGLMGFVIALMGFMVGAFSIPLIMHQRMTFVSAVFTSVATVWHNKMMMLRWALTLALIMFTTLMLALPLLVIVLPVTAYASYEAYVDLLQPDD